MDHVAKIEVTLAGDAARLYEILLDATATADTPGTVTRAVLETGLVHHLLMLVALGVVPEEQASEARAAIARIGERTIMAELFAHADAYWRKSSGGTIRVEQ